MFAALTGALALQTAALGQPRGGRAGRQASVCVSPASARNNILEAREAFLQEGSFLTTKPLCFVRNLSNFPSSCARCCQPRGQHGLNTSGTGGRCGRLLGFWEQSPVNSQHDTRLR